MKNFEEKILKKFFLECVWLGGRKEKKINDRVYEFSLQAHQKIFFPNWRENWKKKMRLLFFYFLFYLFIFSLFN